MNASKTISLGEGLITDLDLSAYTGNPGEIIRTKTRNGAADYAVLVVIRDVLGLVLEEGFATWDPTTTSWAYLTTAEAPRGEVWTLKATSFNSEKKTTREVFAIPSHLRLATEFHPWVLSSAFGQWHRN